MKLLLGLAVSTAFLAGCGGSPNSGTANISGDSVTPPDVTQSPDSPTSPPVVTQTPASSDTPPAETDPVDPLVAPPVLPGAPDAPVATPTVTSNAVVFGDVIEATFDASTGTLLVQVPLDGSDAPQQYIADGQVDGYARFTFQDDPLDREFVGFARESDDGLLQAVIVADGGQFNRYFSGGAITQDGFTPVTTGLASFAGDYVGISNLGPLLVTGNGADLSLVPGSTSQVTGEVFLNVDFVDNQVNGSIFDRVLDFDGTAVNLQDIALTATGIGEDGQFDGTVEFSDLEDVGVFNGAIGGNDGSSIAGIVSLDDNFANGSTINGVVTTQFDDIEGAAEYGLFVLEQCAGGGGACFDAN